MKPDAHSELQAAGESLEPWMARPVTGAERVWKGGKAALGFALQAVVVIGGCLGILGAGAQLYVYWLLHLPVNWFLRLDLFVLAGLVPVGLVVGGWFAAAGAGRRTLQV